MLSKQPLTKPHLPAVLALLAGTLLLAACASRSAGSSPAAPAGTAGATRSAVPGAEEGPSGSITASLAEPPADGEPVVEASPASIASTAPRTYTVQRGDTLWDLANMFLRDPWLWPEIWYVNPQLPDPHRIFPGDVLTLAQGRDGKAQLTLTRGPAVRLSPMVRDGGVNADGSIATIPYEAIRAFLSRPGIISNDEIRKAPYVLGMRDNHIIAGLNNDLYVRRADSGIGERYSIMRIEEPLRSPDRHGKLGYMTVYAGAAIATRTGDPATVRVTESAREVRKGDVLVATRPGDIAAITPHVPASDPGGHVIAITDGVRLGGNYDVVAVDRGSAQGMEVGHVLRVWQTQPKADDRCVNVNGRFTCDRLLGRRLPAEMAGTLLVFKVLDGVSYALVLSATAPIRVNDRVGKP